ncbi:unnamed protein product [Rotaria sp. Silwood2]|nr:unnamed protein product [Rotaria sp. Silwood2]CAF3198056.1 unnamed protein product [Rotaria sp. Silwood2]CAF3327207.1 unnamed protein product [Rotaria sp. Silwood2]CAF4028408.1 unnamed protein product [Rotaria sp. Silwood2]CAF4047802.1 unnamed protein product [Rotaria sp. Silwood2]
MITNQYKLILDNYLLEIYDSRYRRYIILDEEYFDNLKDRLSRTSVSTLNGRIMIPPQMSTRSYLSNDRKRKRTSSFSPQIDYLIIWLDSYIGHPDNCRYLKHKFTITTTLDVARPMLDYELCIDDLIQINSKRKNTKKFLNIFSNKDECLEFFKRVESKMKIIFITSNLFGEEIVPIIIQRVHIIYILVNDNIFSYEWAFDYKSNLLIFDDCLCLLIRLIRDLAKNFVEKAENTSKLSLKHASTLLKWARELYNRANELDNSPYFNIQNSIDSRLQTLEFNWMCKESNKIINNEQDDKFALECDEG